MDYTQILSDATTFPDTLEFTVGTEKITLGAVRAEARRQQQVLDTQLRALDKERGDVKELATKAADLLAKAQPLAEATTRTEAARQPATADEFETDPWWEPVRKRFSTTIDPLQKRLDDAMKAIELQNKTLERAALVFGKRMFREDYERGKSRLKGDKYKEWQDPEKLATYAAQHQLVDDMGMPSVERAIAEITREDELALKVREAYEKGQQEGKIAGRMSTMSRPTSHTGKGGAAPKELDPSKGLEDLGDVVAEDAELMQMLSQLGVNGAADIQ